MGEKSHYFTFDQIKLLLSKVEIIGVWKNSSRDPKMRFLARCFVGKQWNLFMSLWVHFYFNLNWWWPRVPDWRSWNPTVCCVYGDHMQCIVTNIYRAVKYFNKHPDSLCCPAAHIRLTCRMKAGGEAVERGLTPLRLLRTGIPELWLHRGPVLIPARADIPHLLSLDILKYIIYIVSNIFIL